MVEYSGYIEKVESIYEHDIGELIKLTITLTKPSQPTPPHSDFLDDEEYKKEYKKYMKKLDEYKEKIKDYYRFRIGGVRIIQEEED